MASSSRLKCVKRPWHTTAWNSSAATNIPHCIISLARAVVAYACGHWIDLASPRVVFGAGAVFYRVPDWDW